MKAAVVKQAGVDPVYEEFKDPQASEGRHLIAVKAAALSQLKRGRASGTHYSSSGKFPFVVGVDGVGLLPDGRRVYFVMPEAPYGSFAERVLVAKELCIPVPEGLDDVTAAAIANPGMSSWAALTARAKFKSGETVLINGATGASGKLAVQIARFMGAGRVIATGRNLEVLDSLGADVTIPLAAPEMQFKEEFARGVGVVLDYLWGASAEAILVAAAKFGREAVPIRFVNIGAVSGGEIKLPAAALRSSSLVMMGSGIGSVPLPELLQCIEGVLKAAASGKLSITAQAMPLAEIARAWGAKDADGRIVFTL